MKKLRNAVVAGATAAALALTACTGAGEGGTSEPSDEPIKIGLITALTGPYSTLGVNNQLGVEAAIEQINADGGVNGRPLELIIRDDKTEPNQSVVAFNEVIADDEVVAVIGTTNATGVSAVAPQAERAGVLYIGLAPVDEVAAGEFNYAFTSPPAVDKYSERLVEYWVDQGVERVGIIYDSQDVYGETGSKTTSSRAEEAGIEVVFNSGYDPTATDFTALLTQFKNTDAEGLMVWGAGPGPVILTKQYSELGIEPQLYLGGAAASALFLEPAGEAAEGAIVTTSMPVVGTEVPTGEWYDVIETAAAHFIESEGYYPPEFYFMAYSATMLLAEALRNADPIDRETVRDAYASLEMVAPSGNYRITPDNHSGLNAVDIAISEVVNGEFRMTEFQLESMK